LVAEIVTLRRTEVVAMGDEIHEATPMLTTKPPFFPSGRVAFVAASTRSPQDVKGRAASIAG
jgi:hypothetical protein